MHSSKKDDLLLVNGPRKCMSVSFGSSHEQSIFYNHRYNHRNHLYMIVGYNTHESILKKIINDCRKDEYTNNIRKMDTLRRSTKIHPKDGSLASYRPQLLLRKGNVFTSVCQEFCPWGGGKLCIQACTRQTHPMGRHLLPPRQTPPPQRPLQRKVRILLECILVLR